jgi:hypothetical protein
MSIDWRRVERTWIKRGPPALANGVKLRIKRKKITEQTEVTEQTEAFQLVQAFFRLFRSLRLFRYLFLSAFSTR